MSETCQTSGGPCGSGRGRGRVTEGQISGCTASRGLDHQGGLIGIVSGGGHEEMGLWKIGLCERDGNCEGLSIE
jgi:hypothetical protein